MLIWLTISILLVIACVVFGVYSFKSTLTLQKAISPEPLYISNDIHSHFITGTPVPEQQSNAELQLIIKNIQENYMLNVEQLREIQKRIEALEAANNNLKKDQNQDNDVWDDDGEDWEKLYYETRREKQSLEEELNKVNETLKSNLNKLKEFENKQAKQALLNSDAEIKRSEVQALQNAIKELLHKLTAGEKREKDLMEQVEYGKSAISEHEHLKKHNNRLKSELDILTNKLEQVNTQNIAMRQKMKNLTELGSFLEISEYEKTGIKNSVEQILQKI
jgi:hypothetical protein